MTNLESKSIEELNERRGYGVVIIDTCEDLIDVYGDMLFSEMSEKALRIVWNVDKELKRRENE